MCHVSHKNNLFSMMTNNVSCFDAFFWGNSVAAGLCGLLSKKKGKDGDEEAGKVGGEAGAQQGTKKKGRGEFRYSFYLPPDRGERDELVVDDACGNPLFVTMNSEGAPTVRDLGGNVLDVEVGADRMVAVYNTEPLSTTRTRAPPTAVAPTTEEGKEKATPESSTSSTTQ